MIGKYSGWTNIYQKRTKTDFEEIKNKLGQKLAGWKSRSISEASKVVLIKSNLIAIPQYSMNWHKVSRYICIEFLDTNRDFFWNNNKDMNLSYQLNNHFVAWNKIFKPKLWEVQVSERRKILMQRFLQSDDGKY